MVSANPRPPYPKKDNRYPLCRRLLKPRDRSGRIPKISPLLELGPRTDQPIASRYNDYATPALSDALSKKAYCLPERQTSNFKHWILHAYEGFTRIRLIIGILMQIQKDYNCPINDNLFLPTSCTNSLY